MLASSFPEYSGTEHWLSMIKKSSRVRQTNMEQLEAEIESRAARWNCWARRHDTWDANHVKMTEEAKQSSNTPRA